MVSSPLQLNLWLFSAASLCLLSSHRYQTALCSGWLSALDCKQILQHHLRRCGLLSQIIIYSLQAQLLTFAVHFGCRSLCFPLAPSVPLCVPLCSPSPLWAVFGHPLLTQQSKGLTAQNNLVCSTAHHSSRLQEPHTWRDDSQQSHEILKNTSSSSLQHKWTLEQNECREFLWNSLFRSCAHIWCHPRTETWVPGLFSPSQSQIFWCHHCWH